MNHYERQCRNCGRRKRAGVSLIETLAVITLSSTLLVIAVGWIHQSFKLASISRDRQRTQQTMMRLSNQFRDDVHLATAAECADSNQMRLEMSDDKSILYEYVSDGLSRTVFSGDSTQAHDRFYLGPRLRAELMIDQPSKVASVEVIRKPRAGQDESQMIHELLLRSDFGRLDRLTTGETR